MYRDIVVDLEKCKGMASELGYHSLISCKAFVESDREKDRHVIEKKKPFAIYGFENYKARDFMHHRNSGLNQVLCKLMAQNDVRYCVSLAKILSVDKVYRAQVLGRVMQNIRLCRKYKVKMIAGSFASDGYGMRSVNDLVEFLTVLGMHASEAKKAISE